MTSHSPTSFGPYEVLEWVAAGSTGTVYRARHSEIARIVAIKELSPELLCLPGLSERFRGEARTLAWSFLISHTNLLSTRGGADRSSRFPGNELPMTQHSEMGHV